MIVETGPVDRTKYAAAAERALRVHPGPLGELVARELRAFADFGFRIAGDGLVDRLAAEVLAEVPDGGDR
ncbi:hypothetical protein ACFPK1_03390 [Actinomycetospora rhizophila]|uniref:Uncharacterized protein n=1 Tax=Actinomycetospora rhizophila TaxID=1416876 RepID=A0ABV9Z6S2_9PSEU